MRKFLVIGSTGTIGSYLLKFLQDKGEEVVGIDKIGVPSVDILQAKYLDSVLSSIGPSHVIHLAAVVGREHNEQVQSESLLVNIIGSHNVIQSCLKHKCKLTYIGTSESYGSRFYYPDSRQTDEVFAWNDFPEFNGIYGLSKLVGEKLVQHYWRNYHLDYSIARIMMCYSPIKNKSNDQTAISRFMDAAVKNEPLKVHRDTSRSWCYVSDVAEGIYLVAINGSRMYNIGNDKEFITNENLAEKIIKLTGSKSKIVLSDPPRDIFPHKTFNIGLARKELNFEPKISLDKGLKLMYSERYADNNIQQG